MKFFIRNFLPMAVMLLCVTAQAADINSFHNGNTSPLQQLFGLPVLDNRTIGDNEWQARLTGNVSNTFTSRSRAAELIVLDYESYKGIVDIRYGLSSQWQAGIEVPYISHGRGFLDDYIYQWHDFFSMPQNGRNKGNSDLFRLFYSKNGVALVDINSPQQGLGDVRLTLSHSRPFYQRQVVINGGLKLPSGDIDSLTGSGGTDVSIGLVVNDPRTLADYEITLYGGIGVAYLGDIDSALASIQKNSVLTGRVGIGWQATSYLQLIVQYDTSTSLYDSELREIGEPTGQLTAGGNVKINKDISLDLAIVEDIWTSSAPDVVFQAGLTIHF